MSLFSVVFKPLLRSSADLNRSINALTQRFQLAPIQLSALFSSPERVIKSALSECQAKSYVKLFWSLGWHSEIRRGDETVFSTLSSGKTEGSSAQGEKKAAITQVESLEFPNGWSRFDSLNPKATVQAGNAETQAFCIVIPQNKSDFHQPDNHYAYSHSVLKSAVSRSGNCEIIQSCKPLFAETTGWALSLSEFILWDQSQGAHYLLAVYEGRNRFYAIYCWASCQDFAKSRQDFMFVIESFRLHDQIGVSPEPTKSLGFGEKSGL